MLYALLKYYQQLFQDCDKSTNTCKVPGTGNGKYKNKQDCIDACKKLPIWTKIQGLGGNGYCYGPQNSYPAAKV